MAYLTILIHAVRLLIVLIAGAMQCNVEFSRSILVHKSGQWRKYYCFREV